MAEKFFQGESLERQHYFKQSHGELRIMGGPYGLRLVYRGEMGQLMGGNRSPDAVQAKWDSLEIYRPKETVA